MNYLAYLLLSLSVIMTTDPWSAKLSKKIDKTVAQTYGKERSISIKNISKALDSEDLSNNLYDVYDKDELLGYVYVAQAPSMKNVFDYIILFDTSLKIINTKVLIYRENHGRQIGTKRWLSQFFNLNTSDRPELGSTIDGISGATISCTSMTKAVNHVLTELDATKDSILQ